MATNRRARLARLRMALFGVMIRFVPAPSPRLANRLYWRAASRSRILPPALLSKAASRICGAAALIVALALAACGRYGPLEPPPDASAQATPAATSAAPSDQTTSGLAKPKIPPITAPNQPFALDPLLK